MAHRTYGPRAPSVLCLALAAAFATSCVNAEQEALDCDDLAPASEVSFTQVADLMLDDASDKSCASCHNSDYPVYGVNLETRALIYDALITRFPTIYLQVASGQMPKGGDPWDDDDLRALRTWYCRGAFRER